MVVIIGGISVLMLMAILSLLFVVFITVFLVIVIYAVISYIFESMAIRSMYKNLNYKGGTAAWIPFYNKYMLGKIGENKVTGGILAVLNIAIAFSGIYSYIQSEESLIPFAIFLVCLIISFILDIIISHKIYKKFSNKYSDVLTVLSILTLGFLRPIFLFIIRNKSIDKINKK